jgi:hypothetical protein
MLLVLIEADSGKIVSDISFCAWLGASKNKWMDEDGYDIKLVSIESLSIVINTNCDKKILPIGSIEFMKRAAKIFYFEMPKPINVPESLKLISGRKTWVSSRQDLKLPCFIKPQDDLKLFTGFVAKKSSDFDLYPELKNFNGDFFCSEIIEDIQSEWRCFILDGKILNCSNYSGDPLVFPDRHRIKMFIDSYYDAPSGYSLDVCVAGDGTKLIEINDGWSIGNFGCDPQDYFKLLKTRWFEIFRQNESTDKVDF